MKIKTKDFATEQEYTYIKMFFFSPQEWNRKAQLEREDRDCGLRSFSCKKCKKEFKREKDLRYHESSCGEIVCYHTNCGKTFKDAILLKKHLKTHEENFVCEVCGKSFGVLQTYKRHIDTHENKQFECQVCGKKFRTKGNMVRHQKGIH